MHCQPNLIRLSKKVNRHVQQDHLLQRHLWYHLHKPNNPPADGFQLGSWGEKSTIPCHFTLERLNPPGPQVVTQVSHSPDASSMMHLNVFANCWNYSRVFIDASLTYGGCRTCILMQMHRASHLARSFHYANLLDFLMQSSSGRLNLRFELQRPVLILPSVTFVASSVIEIKHLKRVHLSDS